MPLRPCHLLAGPGLLLLDEPLGARDALTRIGMQQLIEDIWRRDGFTAVLVTHDVSEAVALADRILVIDEGRVVLDERVELARPRARGSAAFAPVGARGGRGGVEREGRAGGGDEAGGASGRGQPPGAGHTDTAPAARGLSRGRRCGFPGKRHPGASGIQRKSFLFSGAGP